MSLKQDDIDVKLVPFLPEGLMVEAEIVIRKKMKIDQHSNVEAAKVGAKRKIMQDVYDDLWGPIHKLHVMAAGNPLIRTQDINDVMNALNRLMKGE